jgi:hypothetical protein
MMMTARKTSLMGKKVYSFPNKSPNMQVVTRYAEPYQPTESRVWNSSVMRGIAVAMMVLSCLKVQLVVGRKQGFLDGDEDMKS